MEYSTGTRTQGATDENRDEGTEAAMSGLRGISGEQQLLGTLVRVIGLGMSTIT
mgnify:CR=1 FL=1